jgi:hypothetical protein
MRTCELDETFAALSTINSDVSTGAVANFSTEDQRRIMYQNAHDLTGD